MSFASKSKSLFSNPDEEISPSFTPKKEEGRLGLGVLFFFHLDDPALMKKYDLFIIPNADITYLTFFFFFWLFVGVAMLMIQKASFKKRLRNVIVMRINGELKDQ